jgi:surface polysaccharide O-acyltransferase-like enzyme
MSAVIIENAVCQRRPTVANSSRLAWLDFSRLFAASSIVWLHTPRSPQLASWAVIGRFAVPFFTAGAVFFVIDGLRRQSDRTLREYTINRFRRIYLPFLAWSVIYLAFKAAKKLALPDEPNDFSGIEVLWTGTFWHLWFMPFILIVTLSTFFIGQLILGCPNVERVMCLAMVAMGFVLASIDPPAWIAADTRFCLLAWNALPAACWGLGLTLGFPSGLNQLVASRTTSLVAICSFAALVAWLAAFGRNALIENATGLLLLVAALQPKSPRWITNVGRFGVVAFGIYLAHLLLIKTCEAVAAKLHWPISWQLDLLIFAVAAAGSTWLAWVLARTRRTRWLAA